MTDKSGVYGLTVEHVLEGMASNVAVTHRVTNQKVDARIAIEPPTNMTTRFRSEVGIVKNKQSTAS
jgi:hypothetical protein